MAKKLYRRPVVESPVIDLHGLSVDRGKMILDGVDWTVLPGENWVVLGANGSGKTSLLSALTAYLTPSDGTISVCGEVFGESDWRNLRKKIGLVSSAVHHQIEETQTGLDVIMSGREAIINYWTDERRPDKSRARKILQRLECSHIEDRLWLHLSQGERQRILIGRALMADLRVLILDEPCAGLDPVAREQFLFFLKKLGRDKSCPSLVLVTHHVEEIISIFTHVLMLRGGKVLATGTIRDTLTSKNLSKAFGTQIRLSTRSGRYFLSIHSRKGLVA